MKIVLSIGSDPDGNGKGQWISVSPSCHERIPNSSASWGCVGVLRVVVDTVVTLFHSWSLICCAYLQRCTWLWVSGCCVLCAAGAEW